MISSHFLNKQGFGLEPLDVRILEIIPKFWSDWTRITFQIRILPFQLAPTLDLSITDENDRVISEVTIIETPDNDIEFTMHIPKKVINNRMKLNAILKYEEYGQVDFRSQYINP